MMMSDRPSPSLPPWVLTPLKWGLSLVWWAVFLATILTFLPSAEAALGRCLADYGVALRLPPRDLLFGAFMVLTIAHLALARKTWAPSPPPEGPTSNPYMGQPLRDPSFRKIWPVYLMLLLGIILVVSTHLRNETNETCIVRTNGLECSQPDEAAKAD
jgi:hypothetical protein